MPQSISIHSLRMEGDICNSIWSGFVVISIHSLRMEGDIHRTNHGRRRIISIHSLRMEGDHLRQADTVHVVYFNPLPPHGGRPRCCKIGGVFHTISIHSLRMEGDNCSHRVTLQNVHFNPLPPYGGRPERRCLAMKRFKFQSTPSVWRETFCSSAFRDTLSFQSTPSVWRETGVTATSNPARTDFNPLPPYGGRLNAYLPINTETGISIHSLRMEGDRCDRYKQPSEDRFQSTPSVWRETKCILTYQY